jgi:hypothetical protein
MTILSRQKKCDAAARSYKPSIQILTGRSGRTTRDDYSRLQLGNGAFICACFHPDPLTSRQPRSASARGAS